MANYDSSELWLDVDEEEQYGARRDQHSRKFELSYEEEAGDFHVRNKNHEKQRVFASSYGAGRKRPPFDVICKTKVVIHGTLNEEDTNSLATLLVYDFSFISLRSSTRIKEASLGFEFLASDEQTADDVPRVTQVGPYGTHVTMKTTDNIENTVEGGFGISAGSGVAAELTGNISKIVKKEISHATEIRGYIPVDNWGETYKAEWFMCENPSQKSGIATLLRTCILLERTTNSGFNGCPNIKATADFTTMAKELFSIRPKDEPIAYDPSLKPYNTLEGRYSEIDRWNLGRVDLEDLWSCTFHKEFGSATRGSKHPAKDAES